MKRIYLDNAATTQMDARVLKAMQPFFLEKYGNASSLHAFGREAKEAMNKSREIIAKMIGSHVEEIIFTSGGTESDNMALIGVANAWRNSKDSFHESSHDRNGKTPEGVSYNKNSNHTSHGHIITTKIEHPAVLKACKFLEKDGFAVTYLDVDKHGMIDLDDLRNAIRKDTILVSVMHANNEIGAIQPMADIGKICKEHGVLFHTDAVQTFGKLPIDVNDMNIDLLSASAHKIYGPKGVGMLYVRKGTRMHALIHGGGQESGFRSGTYNVAGIVGFAEAAMLCKKEMQKEAKREIALRDCLIKNILKIEWSWLNGHAKQRLPGNAHFGFSCIEGEALLMLLDEEGIAASTGSACSSTSLEPSHVLMALGLKHEEAHGSLRITLGRFTSKKDIDYLIRKLPACIEKLRKISPFKK